MVDRLKTHSNQSIVSISLGQLANDIIHYTYCYENQLYNDNHSILQHSILNHQTNDKTYIPRLLAIDFKGSVGTFKNLSNNNNNNQYNNKLNDITNEFNKTYNNGRIVQTSSNDINTQQQQEKNILDQHSPIYNQHNYYELSVNSIENITTTDDFRYCVQGMSSSSNITLDNIIDDILDNIRYHVEQCDNLSGFHIIVDIDSGFAGLCYMIIQALKDEYTNNIPIIVFAVNNKLDKNDIANYNKNNIRRILNRCITISNILEQISMYLPIDADCIDLTHNSNINSNSNTSLNDMFIHLSANIIHNITLPYRITNNQYTIHTYIKHMIPLYRLNIVGINCMIPVEEHNMLFNKQSTTNINNDNRVHNNNNSKFIPLYKHNNSDVLHISPFNQTVQYSETRSITKRVARLLDDSDDDNDISDNESNNIHTSDMLLGETIICRGLTDTQQMNMTVNYDTLFNSANRGYCYVQQHIQSPYNTYLSQYISALYDIYNIQSIGQWLQQHSNAMLSLLGNNTNNYNNNDTVDIRHIVQQFTKDIYAKDELIDIAHNIRNYADMYVDLLG